MQCENIDLKKETVWKEQKLYSIFDSIWKTVMSSSFLFVWFKKVVVNDD